MRTGTDCAGLKVDLNVALKGGVSLFLLNPRKSSPVVEVEYKP